MASKLADLQDERLLDCISCVSAIPVEPIKKLDIIGETPLRKEAGAKQHRVIRYLCRAFSFPFKVFRDLGGYSLLMRNRTYNTDHTGDLVCELANV